MSQGPSVHTKLVYMYTNICNRNICNWVQQMQTCTMWLHYVISLILISDSFVITQYSMSEITTLLWHMQLKNPNLITGDEKLLKSMNTDFINLAKILFLDHQTISVTKVQRLIQLKRQSPYLSVLNFCNSPV